MGVVDNLPYPVVLGRDLPVLFDLLSTKHECNVALTRAQTRKSEESSSTLEALPFFNLDIEAMPGKTRKSQKA